MDEDFEQQESASPEPFCPRCGLRTYDSECPSCGTPIVDHAEDEDEEYDWRETKR